MPADSGRRFFQRLDLVERTWDQRVHILGPATAPSRPCLMKTPIVQPFPQVPEAKATIRPLDGLLSFEGFNAHLELPDLLILAQSCRALRARVLMSRAQQAELSVSETDLTSVSKAAHISRLHPALRRLRVRTVNGDAVVVDLEALRALRPAGTVSLQGLAATHGPTAVAATALFAGMLIAGSDMTVRTQCGRHVPLRACRDNGVVRIRGGLCDGDLALLLGALSHSHHLRELDLCGGSALDADTGCGRLLLGALGEALRPGCILRHHRRLPLPNAIAVRAAAPLTPGVPRPSWLEAYADELEGDYVHCHGESLPRVDMSGVSAIRGCTEGGGLALHDRAHEAGPRPWPAVR